MENTTNMIAPVAPVKRRYLSLSTTTVLFGNWALGLLLASAGAVPPAHLAMFFSVSTAIALSAGSYLGGQRERGDKVSILRELSAAIGAAGVALLGAWLVSEMNR